jgi:hypothetical protein
LFATISETEDWRHKKTGKAGFFIAVSRARNNVSSRSLSCYITDELQWLRLIVAVMVFFAGE